MSRQLWLNSMLEQIQTSLTKADIGLFIGPRKKGSEAS